MLVDLIAEDDNDDDEVQTTDQTTLYPRNRPARLEKLKQIKDDLDKEIEYIVIEDKNEIEETGYEPPPLVHPRERFKTFKKTLEKVVDEIKVLGQMPLPPKKRLDRIEKLKKKKKRKKKEDEIQILGHTPMHKGNEVEINIEVNNENRLKQADKVLKDNLKKKLKF